jgi:uncharacterized protein (PEP-CTERM system associated)
MVMATRVPSACQVRPSVITARTPICCGLHNIRIYLGPALGILALATLSGGAFGAEWVVTPSIRTNVLATNNALQTLSAGPSSDTIIGVSPGLNVKGTGAQLKLEGEGSIQSLTYLRDTHPDSLLPRGRFALEANPIEKWFYVDASASAEQQVADPYSLGGRVTSSSEDLSTYSLRVAPSIRRELSPLSSFLARGEMLVTRQTGDAARNLANKRATERRFLARFEQKPVRLGGSLEVSTSRSNYAAADTDPLNTDAVRASLTLAASPDLILGVIGGRERNRLSLESDSSTIHGMSLDWRPSQRTVVKSQLEHRFFGWGGSLEARHRSPFISMSVQIDREPIVQPSSLLLTPGTEDVATLLDAAFRTRYPDPAERSSVVNGVIASQGLPQQLSAPLTLFAEYAQLRTRASLGTIFLGRRSSLSLSLYRTVAERLLLPDRTNIPLLTDNSDYREVGGSASYRLGVTPHLYVGGSLDASKITGLGTRLGENSDQRTVLLTLNQELTPRLTVTGGAFRRLYRSNVNAPSQETAGFVGSAYRF